MCIPTDQLQAQQAKKAESVPLGNGLAQRAKLAIQTRQRRIDEAVENAQR